MAHTISARKRIRQSEKRNLINKSNKSKMKTFIKKYNKALETGAENTETLLKEAVSVIYKTARKVLLQKNKLLVVFLALLSNLMLLKRKKILY